MILQQTRLAILVATVLVAVVAAATMPSRAFAADQPDSSPAAKVTVALQPPQFEISNGLIRVIYDAATGVWGISSQTKADQYIRGNTVRVNFAKSRISASDNCRRQAQQEEGSDGLGPYTRLKVTHRDLPQLEELTWTATVRPGMPYAVIRAAVRLKSDATGPVRSVELVNAHGRDQLKFGSAPADWMCFRDGGGQGGTGVSPMFKRDQAKQSSPATLVIYDPAAGNALRLGWVSWVASDPNMTISANKTEGLSAAAASCEFYSKAMVPDVATEPLLIGFDGDPLVALEQYAHEVRETNHPPLRKDTVMAWLSWYCIRMKMTEQFVLDNAKIVAEKFGPYGIDTMQVDHGWQYKDLVGNWVHNEKFPHGMKWLGEELRKKGLKLGIWMAVSDISNFVPFYQEHPEAVIHDADGKPYNREDWPFKPYGKMYNLDPTHPVAQAHYRQSLDGLMDAGCRYYKIDFIGAAGNPWGVFHDANRPKGMPMARYEMQQIRDAIGPDSWLRYCSSPTNVYCGIVNVGGATLDIDNAKGDWKQNLGYHQQLGSCWYKHRNFWHNEPDCLIVGEGSKNEARVRCAWLVFSGGVVALGDDLTKTTADRMAMIPKCLPSYDVAARPLDLFSHIPSRVWDLHVRKADDDYHAVALFNYDEQPQEVEIPLNRLGLTDAECLGWEFWTETPLHPAHGVIRVTVPPHDSRVVAIRRIETRPQVLATDMHLTMGAVELSDVRWDAATATLSGRAHRIPGASGRVVLRVPDAWRIVRGATPKGHEIAIVDVAFAQKDADWSVQFAKGGT